MGGYDNECVYFYGYLFSYFFFLKHGFSKRKNILYSITKTVGEDQIPYTKSIFSGFTDMISWIKNNYTYNDESPIYYLPETIYRFKIGKDDAIAFKTWEYNNYVQNILIEKGKNLILYSTPHGEYNPDGSVVFEEVLGISIPISEFTLLKEEKHHSLLNDDSQVSEYPPDVFTLSSNFGTIVGSYKNIVAYSNGSVNYFSNLKNYYNGYYTGIKWQCVEYVNRFYKAIFNREITGGNANTYYSNAANKNLNRASNGGTNKPQTGNILCSAGGSYGHVAIIREVGSNYIKVIHQNWCNCTSDNSKTLSMTVSNGKYYVSGFSSSYPVQGWLWPK